MKITKTANNGKLKLSLTKEEWASIGKKANWGDFDGATDIANAANGPKANQFLQPGESMKPELDHHGRPYQNETAENPDGIAKEIHNWLDYHYGPPDNLKVMAIVELSPRDVDEIMKLVNKLADMAKR